MKILFLVASVSVVMAFPKGSSLGGFEQPYGEDEYCIDIVSKHVSTQVIFASIMGRVMGACQNDLVEPIDLPSYPIYVLSFSLPPCKKDTSENCKNTVEDLKEYWFGGPKFDDDCRTEEIKAFVESCVKN